jgi:hypothetical protein
VIAAADAKFVGMIAVTSAKTATRLTTLLINDLAGVLDIIVSLCLFKYVLSKCYNSTSMNKVNTFLIKISLIFIAVFSFILTPVSAAPYGAGNYGIDVPYGTETSITISASSVSLTAVPSGSGNLTTANSVVTVNSTDVVGFKLYISAIGSANLVTGSPVSTITASSNLPGSPAALATNTWGYNTNASANFVGLTTSNVEIKDFLGPARLGEDTTVTYGVMLDFAKRAGSYSATVLYTATPQTT